MAEGIGRFQLQRTLGRGAQGIVHLALDTRLNRQVALKTVRGGADWQALLNEARTVSQLQHPQIITLYDTFEQQGVHYLVLEYVEGETLAARLKREGRLPTVQAVELMRQVLAGLAYAHGKGVVHRDIKPGNIMLDLQGQARIMDFGIAAPRGSETGVGFTATPHYVAPEILQGQNVEVMADVFSCGMVLYEMLTGRRAAEGDSVFAILNKIAHSPFLPPSRHNAGVDEKLDHIVMAALFKDPQERFQSAEGMRQALDAYLHADGNGEAASEGKSATLDFLLRRMRHTKDFPALSQAISAINKIANADSERLQSLSAVILKDFALTNKLLRLVNSATYGQFGGAISTISRAVIILGFDTVRNLAVTLMLFEHLQNRQQANTLREAVARAFFCGLVCRKLGQKQGFRDVEESRICGMFHWLGKLLATFYFHEESMEIDKRIQQGDSEQHAAVAVLGVSYEELGIGVGRAWNFPDKIVTSMQALPDQPKKPQNDLERLRLLANLGADASRAALAPAKKRPKALADLRQHYREALPLTEHELNDWLAETAHEFQQQASFFSVDTRPSETLTRIQSLLGKGEAHPTATEADSATDQFERTVIQSADLTAAATADAADSQLVLAAGVQDITNTLVSDYTLNDLMRMILETMYRGMGFNRVIVATRDLKRNALVGRYGFGPDIERILPRFVVVLDHSADVFRVALEKNADVFIENSNAESISNRIPAWHRDNLAAQTFLLLPLVLDKRIIGLFYADKMQAGSLQINPKELSLLKTLRNQAILAIRQKQI